MKNSWNYNDGVAKTLPIVKKYVSLTNDLLKELRDAFLILPQNGDESFVSFCAEVGMSVDVALRWIDKANQGDRRELDNEGNDKCDSLNLVICELRKLRQSNSELFTIEEASDFLRCDLKWLREQIIAKSIPNCQLNGELRLIKSDLIDWLRGHNDDSIKEIIEDKNGAAQVSAMLKRGAKVNSNQRQILKDKILENLKGGMGITQSVRQAGIAWSTFHEWKKADYDFNEQIKEVRGW